MNDEVKLGETTLRVYLLLIREGKAMSIREVQRALDLSSPGQAYHHLERLRELGLVTKDTDGYRAVRKNGVIEGVIIVRSIMLPRTAFYLGFSAALTVIYLISLLLGLIKLDLITMVAILALLTFSIIEFTDQWIKLRRLLKLK
ncbi:helix-turn-helix domain-containing protein [Caldivirga maquilingensis]|uniref:Regulatory protein ArsR n=1 Tax=Caldivirga maquilingensis (strain ATCC 700844 / DSM 13496 / JCM 10307 / IC-167) TaxID=397948 RepID=A8MCP3_CALMQ|nr:helix-turn-helix domain-containing protein [Caldivirga maquilingensis]ABW01549.1 regulatory protein ArsR [Caldivirga maquilingensis IC-167]